MLYPLLHRLDRLGHVTTGVANVLEAAAAKLHNVTDGGRAALADRRRRWETITRALNDVWPGSGVC